MVAQYDLYRRIKNACFSGMPLLLRRLKVAPFMRSSFRKVADLVMLSGVRVYLKRRRAIHAGGTF
jgi:hypothetical protein